MLVGRSPESRGVAAELLRKERFRAIRFNLAPLQGYFCLLPMAVSEVPNNSGISDRNS